MPISFACSFGLLAHRAKDSWDPIHFDTSVQYRSVRTLRHQDNAETGQTSAFVNRNRRRDKGYDTIRYDTIRECYFNVRSKADMSQLNLPHGTDN